MERNGDKIGYLEGLGCYVIWGLLPIYWKLLSGVSALEIQAWRIVWAAVCMIGLCALVKRTKFLHLFRDPRAVRTFLLSSALILVNWTTYVWAASTGHILETSIGYYLCPFANIVFGMLLFGERLTLMQKIATGMALAGVLFLIWKNPASIWISLVLTISFSLYGAVKKRGGYAALPGMAFESVFTGAVGVVMMALGAVAPWFYDLTATNPDAIAVSDPTLVLVLLVLGGAATAIPLLMYSAAANRITMTALGFFQYVSPTLAFIVAVFMFGEPFTFAHAVCLGLIWAGIVLVAVEIIVNWRKTRASAAS